MENKIYTVVIDPSVNGRMAQHMEFLARVSESAANKLLDHLLTDIRSLAVLPYRNPIYSRPYLPDGKYRYLLSSKRYRIIYQIDSDFVFIDDIEDCRQEENKNTVN